MTKYKLTNQRLAILNFIKENSIHPTAEQVFEGVKTTLPRISLSTVYRNLKQLVQQNKLIELNVQGISHFDINFQKHHHLICRNCNKIIDIEQVEFKQSMLEQLRKNGFAETSLEIYSICNNCKEKIEKNNLEVLKW